MDKFLIILIAAILAGCASAPQPQDEPDVDYRVENPPRIDAPAPSNPNPIEIWLMPSATQVVPQPREVDPAEQRCLAQAMYWEARGEGRDGMVAVSSVVLNRVEDERFPDTVCDVIYDGGETPPCQFSWWCDGKSDRPSNHIAWNQAVNLAHEILAIPPDDPTGGALFYHATSIKTPWRRQRTAQIGRHIFYR